MGVNYFLLEWTHFQKGTKSILTKVFVWKGYHFPLKRHYRFLISSLYSMLPKDPFNRTYSIVFYELAKLNPTISWCGHPIMLSVCTFFLFLRLLFVDLSLPCQRNLACDCITRVFVFWPWKEIVVRPSVEFEFAFFLGHTTRKQIKV